MKTFDDLVFKPHPVGIGTQAYETFDNGYGVSVICGDLFYSNGVDTYELAVLKDGKICYDTPITDDVIGYLSEDEVTEVMKRVQRLRTTSDIK